MLKRILGVLVKTIVGIILFYLIAGFIIVPLVLTWAIPSQATKILKHPVHLHSVSINPLLLQLTMNGFDIQDDHSQVMMGFDQLSVNVSFTDLFKKIYHVKVFEIDGLKVNVELLSGNQINLLELVPPGVIPAKGQAPDKVQPSSKDSRQTAESANKPVPLPVVIIDSIVVHQGQVHFTDTTINPHFSSTLGNMEMTVTNVTTDPQKEAKIKFQANLDEKGHMSMETLVKPLAQPLEMETTFSLNDYALTVLTPYVGKYTGRELRDGKLDFSMDYQISDNRLVASHRVLVQRFEFGKSVPSKDALHLPFGLAVALLEDPQGHISIALPATGDMSNPKFDYSRLMSQVIRNFFFNLITKPFSFLASSLGGSQSGTDELGYVRFSPGKTNLSVSQRKKLVTLINGLKQHPKLLLEIDGSYDPNTDWRQIQAENFIKEFTQIRKTSDRPETKDYQLLYQSHFGIRALWAVAKKYKKGIGEYDDAKLDKEIRRQLIENAPPDTAALSILAQARAQVVHDFFITSGFDEKRLSYGRPQPAQSSMGYVPLQFTLTVFDKS